MDRYTHEQSPFWGLGYIIKQSSATLAIRRLHLSARGESDDDGFLEKDTVSSLILLHYLSTGDVESFEARID
jgi:hypothetical protein